MKIVRIQRIQKYLQDDVVVCHVGIWIDFNSRAVHLKPEYKLQNAVV